ncbi:hypothetical protein DJ031_01350 [bacterium endosymbiont of Escarpia laminata]|nr:MAG: hypothetical protein DJ031_01350 [bacterium endosymbiont of Escarpia laminata]
MCLCVPGMGMILWGGSPLYLVWKEVVWAALKVLADGKGGRATDRLKEARVQTCEPTERNCILRPSPRASQHNMTKPIQISGGG